MRTIKKPNQPELFAAADGVLHVRFIAKIARDWPGIMRRTLLALMPAEELGKDLCESHGRPSKELYSMTGLIFLAEAFGWTHEEAVNRYACDMRVQYALNLGHFNQYLCERTYEARLQDFRESALAQGVFDAVTRRLVQELNLEIKKQRLDSTHVFSDMAHFGRTKLMSETVRRFLHALQKTFGDHYMSVDAAMRERYAQSDAQLFGMGRTRKTGEELTALRQQIAEDMHGLLSHFEWDPAVVAMSGYQALRRVFNEQCVVENEAISVVSKADTRCMQNPSDPDATYDGHKGTGYQAQIVETFGGSNSVNLITAVIAQTAADQDADSVVDVLEQLEQRSLKPELLVADGAYGSDENVLAAQSHDVTLVAPVKGAKKKIRSDDESRPAMHALDFEMDETTKEVRSCPMGETPLATGTDGKRHSAIFDKRRCNCCTRQQQCPVACSKTRDRLDYSDKDLRLEARRRDEQSPNFKDIYRCRAGIEGTMSALKRGLGLGRLPVRGRSAVSTAIYLKAAAYNMKQAVKALKMRSKSVENALASAFFVFAEAWEASRLWTSQCLYKPTTTIVQVA